MRGAGRVLFVFLDGVGIGDEDEERNPWLRARIPTLLSVMGGKPPTRLSAAHRTSDSAVLPLDATMGVDGTPQSGTGQAALLTGENAARLHGGHFGPWTPVGLRPLVEERSVLRRARDAGARVVFANAYPRGWPGPGARGSRRIAGPPLAARGAGILDRHEEALGDGDAVSSEIVNDGWRRHLGYEWLPEITAEHAGRNLALLSGRADLTLYAHYATDTAGHRGGMGGAIEALERVDRFFSGVLDHLPPDTTVVVASDHGNLEDVEAGHTLNPALGMVVGPATEALASSLTAITDVSAMVMAHVAPPT